MGAGNSTHGKARRPEGLVQLNDSVWELYSPSGEPDVDIVFFHGLQALGDSKDAFWKTWLSIEEDIVWPPKWLSVTFPYAWILSISYIASTFTLKQNQEMEDLGKTLVDDIIMDTRQNIGQNRPIFLVGLSLGGIVIKQLILSARRQENEFKEKRNQDVSRIQTFFENFNGVFYYSTPHGDTGVTMHASQLPTSSPLLGYLKTLDAEIRRINSDFHDGSCN